MKSFRRITLSITFLLISSQTAWAQKALDENQLRSLRAQIFLNENNFGPGFIDGKIGNFSRLAIKSYNLKNKRSIDDLSYVDESEKSITEPLLLAIVPTSASKFINPELPESKELQSRQKFMSYRSYAEYMAERYHTSVEFLSHINGWSTIKNLKPRVGIIVPNVQPFLIENLTSHKMFKAETELENRALIIDTNVNQLFIYDTTPVVQKKEEHLAFETDSAEQVELIVTDQIEALPSTDPASLETVAPVTPLTEDEIFFHSFTPEQLIATFPITTGRPESIRRGFWEIKSSVELPEWRYDKSLLETGTYSKQGLNIPGGPNNPVGVMWHGLTRKGLGIHGTSSPETIGRSKSSGCIRLANWDVVKLPSLIRPGTKVWLK